jgi:hypothetical protein
MPLARPYEASVVAGLAGAAIGILGGLLLRRLAPDA